MIDTLKIIKELKLLEKQALNEDIYDYLKPATIDKIEKKFGANEILDCGSYGCAWIIPDQKVLKITTDIKEVKASLAVQRKNYKHYATVYQIFRIKSDYSYDNEYCYVIIKDYLEPLSVEQKDWIDNIKPFLFKNKSHLKSSIPKFLENEEQNFKDFFWKYLEMKQELKGFTDLHSENVGWKSDGTLAAFDSESKKGGVKRVADLQLEEKRERNNKKLFENPVTGQKTRQLLNKIEKKFNAVKILGKGSFGVALLLKDGNVLKVTSDEKEMMGILKIKKKKYKHYATIYKIYKLKVSRDEYYNSDVYWYLFIHENLKTLNSKERNLADMCRYIYDSYATSLNKFYDRVMYAFIGYDDIEEELPDKKKIELENLKKNKKLQNFVKQYYDMMNELHEFDDLHEFNLGWKKDGTLAAFDSEYDYYYPGIEKIKNIKVA